MAQTEFSHTSVLLYECIDALDIRDGYTYKPFGIHVKPDYAVFVEGTDEPAGKYASVIAISLSGIKQYYDEKYDRNNFIKNVILEQFGCALECEMIYVK